jgi:hypothetical protein
MGKSEALPTKSVDTVELCPPLLRFLAGYCDTVSNAGIQFSKDILHPPTQGWMCREKTYSLRQTALISIRCTIG